MPQLRPRALARMYEWGGRWRSGRQGFSGAASFKLSFMVDLRTRFQASGGSRVVMHYACTFQHLVVRVQGMVVVEEEKFRVLRLFHLFEIISAVEFALQTQTKVNPKKRKHEKVITLRRNSACIPAPRTNVAVFSIILCSLSKLGSSIFSST